MTTKKGENENDPLVTSEKENSDQPDIETGSTDADADADADADESEESEEGGEVEEAAEEVIDEIKEAIGDGDLKNAAQLLERLEQCLATHSTNLTARFQEQMEAQTAKLEKLIKKAGQQTPAPSLRKASAQPQNPPMKSNATRMEAQNSTKTGASAKNAGGNRGNNSNNPADKPRHNRTAL